MTAGDDDVHGVVRLNNKRVHVYVSPGVALCRDPSTKYYCSFVRIYARVYVRTCVYVLLHVCRL